MKMSFLNDTTIKITHDGDKFIVDYYDGYADVTKYHKKDQIGIWKVYNDGRYVLIKKTGDTDPVLDGYVKFGTIANLNDPRVKNAIRNARKGLKKWKLS